MRQASSALRPLTRLRALALLSVLALVLAACGGGDKGGEGNSGQAQSGGTVVFAASSDPKGMDPALVSDGESSRVTNQIFEGLVRTKSGSLEIEPALAESWTANGDGTEWTFKLRSGVRFHDGTPFNAEAVCFNFDRQYNFKGLLQNEALSYYWNTFFGGFSDKKKPSLYVSCSAPDETTAVIKLASASASFIPAMSQFAFAIQSPKALQEFGADKVSGNEEAPKFNGTYALEHPTGTGPMRFDSYKANDRVTLVRNDGYWGTKATVDRLIFRTISDNAARRQALEAGEIQGYDQVDPADLDALRSNFNVLERPPLNLAYVGMNQSKPPLDNPKIRQAVAYALNGKDFLEVSIGDPKWYRECKSLFPCGSPLESTAGWEDKLGSNVAKAKQLLQEAGYDGTPIVLMQQTDIAVLKDSAPMAKQLLEKAGFKVDMQSMDWQTLVSRRAKKEPPAQGGWHAFVTTWSSAEILDPVATTYLNASCEKATFGWPCDAEIERLRDAFAKETDPAKQKAIAEAVQVRAAEYPTHIHLGQYTAPVAFRKNLQGVLVASNLVLWNIEKK